MREAVFDDTHTQERREGGATTPLLILQLRRAPFRLYVVYLSTLISLFLFFSLGRFEAVQHCLIQNPPSFSRLYVAKDLNESRGESPKEGHTTPLERACGKKKG